MTRSTLVRRIRRIWITLGLTATAIFVAWSLYAYRATPEARAAARGDATVSVRHEDGAWRFEPAAQGPGRAGLLFIAGSLVDPRAYAPLARAVAAAGYEAVILELPRRGAFGGADDPALLARARALMRDPQGPPAWVLAGHSRGAVVASRLAAEGAPGMAGLVLIGTSHPRDVSLTSLTIPVVKIAGTRDGLASPPEVEANRQLLPAATRWIWVKGGNHSQFGWYHLQPGDRTARIPADSQRTIMTRAVVAAVRQVAEGRP